MKVCSKCNKEKVEEEFNFRNRCKNIRCTQCRLCVKEYYTSYYSLNRKKEIERAKKNDRLRTTILKQNVLNYLTTHPCVDCGEADPIVLEFDHVRGIKHWSISNMVVQAYGWSNILNEIDKCDVRCANCHRKRTAQRGDYFRHLAALV